MIMLKEIEFIQYLPNDTRKRVMISRGSEIADKADAIKEAGYRLECKAMGDGAVAVGISDPGADEIIASRVLENGAGVPLAVDDLINELHGWLTSSKQFTAGYEPKQDAVNV